LVAFIIEHSILSSGLTASRAGNFGGAPKLASVLAVHARLGRMSLYFQYLVDFKVSPPLAEIPEYFERN